MEESGSSSKSSTELPDGRAIPQGIKNQEFKYLHMIVHSSIRQSVETSQIHQWMNGYANHENNHIMEYYSAIPKEMDRFYNTCEP